MSKIMNKFLVLLIWLTSLLSLNASAHSDFYASHAIGWHWYEAHPADDEDSETQADPISAMNAVRQTVQRALDNAVLNPTPSHVKTYLNLQNEVTEHANRFNQAWQQVLLENPNLNFSLKHPTNNLAKEVEYNQKLSTEESAITMLGRSYQLYFFYRSSCQYCQRFAPIVKTFAQSYGMEVVSITTDGIALPDFPDSFKDQGEASSFEVTAEPAIFLVNPTSHKAARIGTGLLSQAEIKRNIMLVLPHLLGGAHE